MAELPEDRVNPGPPFTSVGVDVFGPWQVVARRTRGGLANSKRWAVLDTCLSTRAVHIEVIEELSTSSFINATRIFIAIRGKVSEFRSGRGTNFVGATDPMRIDAINVVDKGVKEFLFNGGTVWRFNVPHSSRMGGVWERMIGVVRRILDAMMAENSTKDFTHDVLATFLAEVSATVNSRPIVPVSTDPENPMVLSPTMVLTQKHAETSECVVDVNLNSIYREHWRRVQALSDIFWRRWRLEFLQALQNRRKWKVPKRNLQKGEVVLVTDKECHRNEWPMGIATETYPSEDSYVRKVSVNLLHKGQRECKEYTRPVTELVLLIESTS